MDEALLKSMLSSKQGDFLPLLVYADWLDEQGDLRGQFLRFLHQQLDSSSQIVKLAPHIDPTWAQRVRQKFQSTPLDPAPAVDDGQLPEYERRFLEESRRRFSESILRLQQDMQRIRTRIASGVHDESIWSYTSLQSSFDNLARFESPQVTQPFRKELEEMGLDIAILVQDADMACNEWRVRQAFSQPLHNSASVKSILVSIDSAISGLLHVGRLRDEIRILAREGKERAARFRYQRKFDEASVAEAGGKARKANSLRQEAQVMLLQDWSHAFPGELPPET